MKLTPPPATTNATADGYLANGYRQIVGMSSHFAAAITCRLMAIQSDLGVIGSIGEIGTFEGRFFIAMSMMLKANEKAIGIDLFEWPNPEVLDRFEAHCARHGLSKTQCITMKADSRKLKPEAILAHTGGQKLRLFHVDGEHSRHALSRDLKLAKAVTADDGLIILDDMLHPGYPTLMVTVQSFLKRNPDMVVLCVIDRESITGATKFVLCRRTWFKRYEAVMLDVFKQNIWPLGADFEPHWCLVLSMDTHLAAIT
jgi:hypothetical protein